MPPVPRYLILLCFGLLLFPSTAFGKVHISKYGQDIVIDSAAQSQYAVLAVDSLVHSSPLFQQKTTIYSIERPHILHDKTLDFYLLLLLSLMLGLLRYLEPKYFDNLWKIFRNPGQGRAARDQLDLAVVPNFIMNVFFAVVCGAYLYYVVGVTTPIRPANISSMLLVLMLIAGITIIYTAKYFAVRFSGWAFKIEDITKHYIFNIFLVNKITAIILFPFVLMLAFGAPALAGPAIIISISLIVTLLIVRYIRSWQLFGSFFQYSKFHFFTYLCASEILPLAVLVKLLVRGLLY